MKSGVQSAPLVDDTVLLCPYHTLEAKMTDIIIRREGEGEGEREGV